MFYRGIAAVLIFAQMTPSFAQVPRHPHLVDEPYTLPTVKLIGKGLENRDTGDVLALACVGDLLSDSTASCKKLRHVKWKNETKELFLIGRTLTVNTVDEPTEEDFKKLVKEVNRQVRTKKKSSLSSERRQTRTLSVIAAVVGVGSLATFALTSDDDDESDFSDSSWFGPAIYFGMFGFLLGVAHIVSNPVFPKSGIISNVLANQDGWNWSVETRVIRPKKFKMINTYLKAVKYSFPQTDQP